MLEFLIDSSFILAYILIIGERKPIEMGCATNCAITERLQLREV